MQPTCPRCSAAIESEANYCPSCGFNLYIESNYPKASLGNRFLASVIDSFVVLGLAIPGLLVLIFEVTVMDNGPRPIGIVLILLGALLCLIPLVYIFIKDGIGQGQSYGKKAMNLMVINIETNRPCDKPTSLVRNLVSSLVSAVPYIGWLVEPIMVLATENGRKLGDWAAKTQVIEQEHWN